MIPLASFAALVHHLFNLVGTLLGIPLLLFAAFYFWKYEGVRKFFNDNAKGEIVPAEKKLRRPQKIAVALGVANGIVYWYQATGGGPHAGHYLLASLMAFGCIGLWVYYLKSLAERTRGQLPESVHRWSIIYEGFLTGAAFSISLLGFIFIVAYFLYSIVFKGLRHTWDSTFSYGKPSRDGSKSYRQCRACNYYRNDGFCTYHNTSMPPDGGCGQY